MSNYKINLINHSCIKIENEKHSMLIDPWFSSTVFNNSWSLIRECGEEFIDFSKLTHILISHEHPDHLNWPTLKKIRQKKDGRIWILMGKRENDNIKEAVIKMGFDFAYIPEDYRVKITENLHITNYSTGHDSGQVIEINEHKIFNQNDCKFSDQKIRYIKQKHGHFDALFYQFGLAGYYGNREDSVAMEAARQSHISLIRKYFKVLSPDFYVPYASHIRFCKEHNDFLNKWQVTIPDLFSEIVEIPTQYLFYGSEVIFDKDKMFDRNVENVKKWQDVIDNFPPPNESKDISKDRILDSCLTFSGKYEVTNTTPGSLVLRFFDDQINQVLLCNFKEKTFEFIEESEKETQVPISGILPAEEFLSFLKFPWGADTLNITSCFDIIDKPSWRNMLIWKDQLYKR